LRAALDRYTGRATEVATGEAGDQLMDRAGDHRGDRVGVENGSWSDAGPAAAEADWAATAEDALKMPTALTGVPALLARSENDSMPRPM